MSMICPNCGREIHEKQVYGLRFIPRCTCQEEAERILRQEEILRGTENLAAAYLRLSGVSKRYRTADLHSIQPRDGQEKALEACWKLAENLESGEGLLLVGGVGSGKTLLASAAAVRLAKKQAAGAREDFKRSFARVTDTLDHLLRPWVQVVSTVALFPQLKACFDGNGRAEDILEKYKAARLLVLDDLGAEKATEWVQERLFEIIDSRYGECLPLLVTSNLLPAELEGRLGKRIADRLREMCRVVNITTASQRATAGRENKAC